MSDRKARGKNRPAGGQRPPAEQPPGSKKPDLTYGEAFKNHPLVVIGGLLVGAFVAGNGLHHYMITASGQQILPSAQVDRMTAEITRLTADKDTVAKERDAAKQSLAEAERTHKEAMQSLRAEKFDRLRLVYRGQAEAIALNLRGAVRGRDVVGVPEAEQLREILLEVCFLGRTELKHQIKTISDRLALVESQNSVDHFVKPKILELALELEKNE